MWKVFEKIREAILGERDAIELGRQTLKNKKLSDNQKLTKILHDYGKYFKEKHADAVDLMTWELHYEDFMIDGKTKHQLRFERFYKDCDEQLTYANTVGLVRQITSLQNVDVSKCSPTELNILKGAKILTGTYNNNFDYEGFYTRSSVRESVTGKNSTMSEMLVANYNIVKKSLDQGVEK